ncbi:MAG: PQQ-binding-like beta-propeller repeat protein, partial [bacterium]
LHPSSFVFAGDWPTFRGNNARTGFAAEQAYPPLTPAWEIQAGAGIISSPVVFDGIVYFGSRDNRIYARNARTGAPIWQFRTGGWVDAAPTVSGDNVYVPSMDGFLYVLNRLTGTIFWRAPLGAPSVSSPLVLDSKVFMGTGSPEKKLKVFNESTGQLLFEYSANQPVDSPPATDGVRVYFGANDGNIYAITKTASSPELFYQTMGGSYGINAVAVSSGILYALPGHDEKKPLALNTSNGILLNSLSGAFEENDSWEQIGSPVVTKDRMYFSGGAEANTLYALDISALDRQQTEQSPPYVWPSSPTLGSTSNLGILSSPAMANEIIYAGTVDGSLVAFTSAAVSVPLVADVTFSSPVYSSPGISNGMIFVATFDGKLAAYKTAKTVSISNLGRDQVVNGTVTVKGYVVNPALTGYELKYGQGEDPGAWQTIISSSTVYSIENVTLADWDTTGLANGVYTLKLAALENPVSGTDNTALLTVRVNAAPPAPSQLAAADVPNDNGNKIRLDWTAPASGSITAYKIYRDAGDGFAETASVSSAALTHIDSSAVTGTTFTYTVRAFDGYVESENSNSASAYSINDTGDNIPPAKINDLDAEPGDNAGTVLLSWTAPGNDGDIGTASHYTIKHTSSPTHNWNDFDAVSLGSSTISVEGPAGDNMGGEIGGLFGGVTYYFAVKTADFASNLSLVSNIATACATIDLVPPLPPAGLLATDTLGDDGGSLTLTWTLSPDDGALANDVYGYRIYRRTQTSAYVSASPLAMVSKGINTYIDATATENIRFYYSVAAFDSTNNSPLSAESNGISADNWRFFDASQGGSIRLADGARVDIPGNAASQNDNIMVSKLNPVTYQPMFTAKANTQAKPTAIVYEVKFKNPNTTLTKPALLTLPYASADIAGMKEENLRIYTLVDGTWLILNTSKVDYKSNLVTAEVLHFSYFRIMEYVPSGDLISGNAVYTYPNPAKGNTLTFKFRTAYDAYVTIDVYNVAGEKIARFEKSNCPAGLTSEIVWNIGNIASGVYQYKLEAKSAAGSKSLIKRLAIIH